MNSTTVLSGSSSKQKRIANFDIATTFLIDMPNVKVRGCAAVGAVPLDRKVGGRS